MAILQSRTKTGISWISESIALFKQAPRKWTSLALTFFAIFAIIPSIPGLEIFGLLTMLIWPVFVVFAARLYRNEEVKKEETLSHTMAFIQPKVKPLIILGFINIVYLIAISVLSTDAQAFAELMNNHNKMSEQELAAAFQTVLPNFLMFLLLLVPMVIVNWFSPMLIAFNQYSVIKAIKSSLAGCLQYWVALLGAWLLLSSGIMALMVAASLIGGLFVFASPGMAQTVATVLVFGAFLLAIALTFAFQYVSYRDVFRAAPEN